MIKLRSQLLKTKLNLADFKTGRKHVLFLTKIDEKLRFHFLMAFLIKLKISVIVYK